MTSSNRVITKDNADRQSVFEKFFSYLRSFWCFLKHSYKILILVALVAVMSVAVSAWVAIMLSNSGSEIYLPSVGTIKTIGVEAYEDSDGVIKQDSLSWDEIKIEKLEWDEIAVEPISTIVYVKSVSNYRVTMDIFLSDWSPEEISDYLTISWDYEGEEMDPGQIVPVTLTLSAPSSDAFIDYILENAIQRFDVSIHFVATE